jgi:phage terminase large subunit-like protein
VDALSDLPPEVQRILSLPRELRLEALTLFEEKQRRKGRRSFYSMFPDTMGKWDGPKTSVFTRGEVIFPRAGYPRHLEFFAAGARYRERCFMAGNRVGKTVTGCFEDTGHLTGEYPTWWEGRRFDRPTRGWVAGKTNETTRDIIQAKLFGPVISVGSRKGVAGTGIVPGDLIGDITWKQGVADLIDTVKVKHKPSGQWSVLGLKSYQQGRGAFEGTEMDFIHLDEEPPADIYGECLIRTATTNGIVLITFTPLEGMSEVVMSFLPADMRPGA